MKSWPAIISLVFILMYTTCAPEQEQKQKPAQEAYADGRPYTRWWWFAGELKKPDIRHQLNWMQEQGFGGVEIAFIYPVNRNPEAKRTPFLSREWTEMVSFAKQTADSLGMGCDFTFGTLWPFGGTFVPDSDATKVYGTPDFRQPLRLSWTHPDTGNVLDHLSRGAFKRYAGTMAQALAPALEGTTSALFCDSWEVETRRIWTDGLAKAFQNRFGYDITPYMDSIYSPAYSSVRYDYMSLVADMVTDSFYRPFTRRAHQLDALTRVQCAGSPADILNAYAAVDVPETEAMLYEPNFAQIPASAALLSGKPVISSETFTCLYGFPDTHFKEEKPGDLKMVADALFANGVNQVIWHGKPYNPRGTDSITFYATVHVGPTGKLSGALKPFNAYMTKVSRYMRKGRPYSDLAVYLPLEDARVAGEYPDSLQMPWSWGVYEMRYVHYPGELQGYQPHWINAGFLEKAQLKNGELHVGQASFHGLVVDAQYLSARAVKVIKQLASAGFPVYTRQKPGYPGKKRPRAYTRHADSLMAMAADISQLGKRRKPFVSGGDIPPFRARKAGDTLYLFFAHPRAQNPTLPLDYGFAAVQDTLARRVELHYKGKKIPLRLQFEPYQSLMLQIQPDGTVRKLDIAYRPE